MKNIFGYFLSISSYLLVWAASGAIAQQYPASLPAAMEGTGRPLGFNRQSVGENLPSGNGALLQRLEQLHPNIHPASFISPYLSPTHILSNPTSGMASPMGHSQLGNSINRLEGTLARISALSAFTAQMSVRAIPGSSGLLSGQSSSPLRLEIPSLGTPVNPAQPWLAIADLPKLLTGNGTVVNATHLQVNGDGTVSLTGSGLRAGYQDGLANPTLNRDRSGVRQQALRDSIGGLSGSQPTPSLPNILPSPNPLAIANPLPSPSPTPIASPAPEPNRGSPSPPALPPAATLNPQLTPLSSALQANPVPPANLAIPGNPAIAPSSAFGQPNTLALQPNSLPLLNLGLVPELSPPHPGQVVLIGAGDQPPGGPGLVKEDATKIGNPSFPQTQNRQLAAASIDPAIQSMDSHFSREFANYLGLPQVPTVKTVEDLQATLQTVEQSTGVKSALIYVNFVPAILQNSSEKTIASPNPQSTDQLELVMVTSSGLPVRHRLPQATRQQVLRMAQVLRKEVSEPRKVSTTSYLQPAQQLYQWIVAPLTTDLVAQRIHHLSFIMETGLRTLPISVLHDGRSFIIETYSVGLIPSLALTDLRLGNWKQAQIWGLGVSESTQGQIPLPSVPTEIKTIIGQLWSGQYHLNQDATLATLKTARQKQAYGIFHLSTHANFNSGASNHSFIQLWNERLNLDQFRELGWSDPPVELLTLSACRTAVGNRESELGYAGLSVQAGVKSVVASLWNVSDAGTSALMTQFYEDLRTAPTKADALRQAQLLMAKGRVILKAGRVRGLSFTESLPITSGELLVPDMPLSHPYFWSAFTLVGSPW